MIKKIIAALTIVALAIFAFAFTNKKDSEFTYSYQIVANSNSAGDLLDLYKCKEHLVKTYNNLVLSLESSHHEEAIKLNINRFVNMDNARSEYIQGVIVVTIGDGKGSSIHGNLKLDYCDNTVVDKKFFILDLLFSW